MSENKVVTLREVSLYSANDPEGRLSIKQIIQRGELVLDNINLEVKEGEFIYLIGRVGSGKSTLLKTLYGELPLMKGEGEVVGYNLKSLKQKDIPYLRRRIGIVFQNYSLLNDRNVFMNLHYVMRATGWRKEAEIATRIEQVLGLVNLQTKGYKMPYELSGGEQQRLVIARALLNAPDLLLADEPTGNLDPITTNEIMELFQKITQNGCAVIMSTHNTSLLEDFPARSILCANGKIREVAL